MEVYLFSLEELRKTAEKGYLLGRLSEQERETIQALKSPKKRLTTLGGRLLLQYVCRIHGITSFQLAYGKEGKPFFLDVPDVCFNLSHSEDYLALAWSTAEIGIDLEKIRREMPKFPERMLSETDFRFLQKQEPHGKKQCFFQLWTRKESLSKLCGGSIFRDARTVSVTDGNSLLPFLCNPPAFFHTHQWKDYVMSVCTLEEGAEISIEFVTLEEIVS